jgi:ABC-2 type transport system ATP-binding protein
VDHPLHRDLPHLTPRPVQVEDVVLDYGGRRALDGVSLDVGAGEIVGLLGPNGSGKTSLFRILCTLLAPTAGRARVAGFDVVAEYRPARRRIGVVFQSPALDRKLTARENLRHQGRLYGLSGRALRERVEAGLAWTGLRERARDLVGEFSGGMRRRLDLARGLMHGPELLLLDEPTESLDPGARRDFWDLLEDRQRRHGLTVFLTTHSMEEGERCDRVGILASGRLVAMGTPSELKSQIRGDVVTAETPDPEALAADVEARFGGSATALPGAVRTERERGHEFVARLAEAFPGRIDSLRVGRPTLEDVFAHVTGRSFREDE